MLHEENLEGLDSFFVAVCSETDWVLKKRADVVGLEG
jgi:hypothetical protein